VKVSRPYDQTLPAPVFQEGSLCIRCKYDLTGVPAEKGMVICPECARRHFAVVPPRSVYLCTCTHELTGQPILPDGFVQCPSCDRRWNFRFLHANSSDPQRVSATRITLVVVLGLLLVSLLVFLIL